MLSDVLDRSVVELYTSNGKKFVHFLAYGFLSEENANNEKPYRIIEYTFFTAPLSDVLKSGIYENGGVRVLEYELDHSCEYKQYVEDCDGKACLDLYMQAEDGGLRALLPIEFLNESTPDGVYIPI